MEARIVGLIEGRLTRQDATDWAMQWVAAEDAGVDDEVVWKALNNVVGADALSTDRPYLYDDADFHAWLDELRTA